MSAPGRLVLGQFPIFHWGLNGSGSTREPLSSAQSSLALVVSPAPSSVTRRPSHILHTFGHSRIESHVYTYHNDAVGYNVRIFGCRSGCYLLTSYHFIGLRIATAMDTYAQTQCSPGVAPETPFATPAPPQLAILDFFFPGFSVISTAFVRYLGIDLNVYLPVLIMCGAATFAWKYFSDYVWGIVETYFMSSVEIRTDDEIYNMLMAWVASQRFAKRSRRFVANTNLNSRAWALWRWDADDEDDTDNDVGTDQTPGENGAYGVLGESKKVLAYTPSFGSHTFWYKGRLLRFSRSRNQQQGYMTVSESEEISISCFGRNPLVLKQLLLEARSDYLKKDTKKTMIYRGNTRNSGDPSWQRCMARTARPFSTVILNEKKKKELVDDVADYLSPATRNWYSNRGIPWRRGYLLTGPPGTGKSSLSLALAGYFKMRIYIVNLNSISASEDSLASLFSELPQRCIVLLEDIDSAGLTHTREQDSGSTTASGDDNKDGMVPGQLTTGDNSNNSNSRLSLSGLLNVLDGVASQEGRVLVMTTNHIEKLDKALIRPGRVDMTVNFTLADLEIAGAIFRAIYAPLECEATTGRDSADLSSEEKDAAAAQAAEKQAESVARIEVLSQEFAAKIPEHEFSPAEIQGFLMRHKHDPEAAIRLAEEWIVETRKQKKEKEIKAAEEKRKAEQTKKEEEEKKKKEEEEEKKKKEEEEEKKKKEEEEEKKKEEEEEEKKKKEEEEEEKKKEVEKKQEKGREKGDVNKEASQSTEPVASTQVASGDVEKEGKPQEADGLIAQPEGHEAAQPGKDRPEGRQDGPDSGYVSPSGS
ncbi:hypothetical protein SODALDRAFT_381884 [Sodiomyces alkalinus F11]|uniref:P-loop containing nucleoside triphosphate hydrolase protein n=1 Tax=Sodiomyces alkalinus (strain CBS 110278 / VKM F-3762 / F11) TaxID=1314773 RepID=A0A3N2PK75_SODAK|nr:hypothetical protein SODALDRAFT_381884 [Sodiomyces alkalinus F11]ROT34909.1 hypothetical protein SODALDRAFT_381884 [Sodiomyces alkalinus F11]